jgi:hypothetical protein
MKTNFIWLLLLWFVLVLEQARVDLLLSQSLLMPVAVACLFWQRNGAGSVLAGIALTVHWLLQPVLAPIAGAVVLVLATMLIARGARQATWSPTVSRKSMNAWWVDPLFVLVVGLACHSIVSTEFNLQTAAPAFLSRLLIAIPALLLLLFASHAAEEFGWRKVSQM